jgi:predicted phosphate transport protein (TIGR00153 family)
MKLDAILQFLVPKDKNFFPLFEQASANLVSVSKVLVEAANNTSVEKRRELIKEVARLEHKGDDITHEIFHELSASFITPFDREDIHSLTSAIDDIIDFIHGSAKRMDLYKIDPIPEAVIKLSELVLKSAEELNIAICELRNMKNVDKIKEACVRINALESHADDIYNMAVARLFEEEKNAVEVIKIKEILSALETATDKCEDAADVLKSIIVKVS